MKSVRTDAYQAVLAVVIAARAHAGIMQQQLADLLDKLQSFVSKYENGEHRLDMAEFLAILQALNCDPYAALGEILSSRPFRRAGKGPHPATKRARR